MVHPKILQIKINKIFPKNILFLVCLNIYYADTTNYKKTQMNSKFWARQTITENTVWDALVACGILCSRSGADICNAFRYEDNTCKMARVSIKLLAGKYSFLFKIQTDCDCECEDSDEKVDVFIDYSSVLSANGPDACYDAGTF